MTAVKDIPSTVDDVTARTERASQRYYLLIEELSREGEGRRHGWQTRVAKQLDVDQSYISRLSRQEKVNPKADAIERAISRLRLRPEYFYGAIEPGSYHDYVIGANEPIFKAWRTFREKQGANITDAERIALSSIVFPEGDEPTAVFYEYMLLNLRNQVTKVEMERGMRKAAELDEKLAKKRRPKG